MAFETLPNKLGSIPEQRFAPVAPPPVYDTQAAITPLLKLAQYMSPDARALRKAAVAKANYEYRLYASGGDPRLMKDPFFKYKLRTYQMRNKIMQAQLGKLVQTTGIQLRPEVAHAYKTVWGIPIPSFDQAIEPEEEFQEPELPEVEYIE